MVRETASLAGSTSSGEVVPEQRGESTVEHVIERDVRKYLDVVDQLRSCGIENCTIELPRIAVMGDQSSGKSSVLEALSGIEFPKGTNLVTRCATEVRMKKTSAGSKWKAVLHTTKSPQNQQTTDHPGDIGNLINELTSGLCEPGCVSSESIIIDVTAPDVPNLTVIDLPGIVQTATTDQKAGFKQAVNSLIEKYIKSSRTIILAVVPSNVDIANVSILERAFEADPEGSRTIGVLTKPDLIDDGTEKDLIRVLKNEIKPLKLGYVVVKNRGQKQIEANVSLSEAKDYEEEFFKTNEHYSRLIFAGDEGLFGVTALATKLTRILVKRIKALLPQIMTEISTHLVNAQQRLFQLGKPIGETKEALLFEMSSRVQKFSQIVQYATQGKYTLSPLTGGWVKIGNEADEERLAKFKCYTRVHNEGFEKFSRTVKGSIPDFKSEKFLKDLEHRVALSKGRELPGFLNYNIFEEICKSYSERARGPADMLVSHAEVCLSDMVRELCDFTESRYPKLQMSIKRVSREVIAEVKDICLQDLASQFEYEEQPFTLDAEYVEKIYSERIREQVKKVDKSLKKIKGKEGDLSFEELSNLLGAELNEATFGRQDIELLAKYLKRYWELTVVRLVDNVCRAVDTKMIRRFADAFNLKMLDELKVVEEVMAEEPETVQERTKWSKMRKSLENGMDALQAVM